MEGMHHRNVTILDGANQIQFWTGSPSVEGGELTGINMTPVGGPPSFSYDTTGKDRKQYKFNLDSKIPGANKAAQDAYIARYKIGTVSQTPISAGFHLDWIGLSKKPT